MILFLIHNLHNTPTIIQYGFWKMTDEHKDAAWIRESFLPRMKEKRKLFVSMAILVWSLISGNASSYHISKFRACFIWLMSALFDSIIPIKEFPRTMMPQDHCMPENLRSSAHDMITSSESCFLPRYLQRLMINTQRRNTIWISTRSILYWSKINSTKKIVFLLRFWYHDSA